MVTDPAAAELLFVTSLSVHVAAGVTCVVSGAVAALSVKGGRVHRRAGRVYVWAFGAVVATVALMTALRWPETAHLLAIGLVALAFGSIGYLSKVRPPAGTAHIAGMGMSYVALLTGSTSTTARTCRCGTVCRTGASGCCPA